MSAERPRLPLTQGITTRRRPPRAGREDDAPPGDLAPYRRLSAQMTVQGRWLFRWRGIVPVILLPVAVVAIRESLSNAGDASPESLEHLWRFACLGVSLLGVIVRVAAVGFAPVGTSGRGTNEPRARQLNTTGLYSVMRNPIYVGNFLVVLGIALGSGSWWFPPLAMLLFAVVHERVVLAEEEFLAERFPEEYRAWVEKTPAFVPHFRSWRPPDVPFSLRSVLRREYMSLAVICGAFLGIELIADLAIEHQSVGTFLAEDSSWVWLFGLSLGTGLALRAMKRHTRWLNVAGHR